MMMFVPMHGQDTIAEYDSCYKFWPHRSPVVILDTVPWVFLGSQMKLFERHDGIQGSLVYGVSVRGDLPLDSSINFSLWYRDERDAAYTFHDTAYLDSSVVYRYLMFDAQDGQGQDDAHNEQGDVKKYGENCNEIYFHRPWPVPDTFFVVARYCQDMQFDPSGRYRRLPVFMAPHDWPVAYCITEGDTIVPMGIYPGGPDYDTSQPLNLVGWQQAPWGREFPILEPNRTRCRKPTGLHFSERGDTWAILSWNGGAGDLYRVTVEGPDSTYIRETADTSLLLENLTPNVTYWVNLQSLCNYQYYAFSSTYVNPGVARVGFQTFANGMSTPDADLQIALSPNPASQKVEVTSSQPMTRIEVVDAMGRVVESFAQANEDKATLDVSLLPAGAYLLRIHTSVGLSCQKLLVR